MSLGVFHNLAWLSAGPHPLRTCAELRSLASEWKTDSTVASRAFVRGSSMNCFRCQSLMCREVSLYHHSTDYTPDLNDVRAMTTDSYRCLCCGNVEDAVILANRAKQADERRLVAEAEIIVADWASLTTRPQAA